MRAPRRALLYGRVSKPDRSGKQESSSVDQQLDQGRRRAQSQDWRVVGEFRDDGVSASRYAATKIRPEWHRAVDVIIACECDVLVLWEVSRATRDRMPYAMLVAACIEAEVWIDVGGKLHDPADPDDGFMLDLQAGLAVRESGLTSKRIRADVEARAQAGRPHGKLPYGYLRTYEQRPNGRILLEQLPDPETAPVVSEMVRRLLAGESAYSIAADLDARGIPCPEAYRAARVHGTEAPEFSWRPDTIRDIALSPTVAGQRIHQGRIVGEATWEAIISPADHVAVTALLRGETRVRNHRHGTLRHLLTGIAVCGVCGTPLRHIKNRGTPSYSCPGPQVRGDSCVTRAKVRLDAWVTVHVVRRLTDPRLLADLAAARRGADHEAGAAVTELSNLKAQLSAFVTAAAEGKVSAESFASIEAGLQLKIVNAKARLPRVAQVPSVVVDTAGPDAEQLWNGLDLERQRQIIRALVHVVVHRTSMPKGSRTFDPSTIEIIDRV